MWPPRPTIFPGTPGLPVYERDERPAGSAKDLSPTGNATSICQGDARNSGHGRPTGVKSMRDRKSTRLNSSHVRISYAVFCLKKKKKKKALCHYRDNQQQHGASREQTRPQITT